MELRPLPELPSGPSDLSENRLEAPPEADEAVDPDEAGAPQTQDPLKLYVRQIGDGRLLTAAEERELARRKDEGDEAAKRRLIESTCGSSCPSPGTTRTPASRCST